MKLFRYTLFSLTLAIVLSACGVLNSLIPDIEVPDGALGLGGAAGTEVSGSFTTSTASLSTLAASASFSIEKTVADPSEIKGDDRVKGIDNIKAKIGMALYEGNIAIKLSNPNNSYPDTIIMTGASYSVSLTDDTSNEAISLSGDSIPLTVTLTKEADCTTECGYSVAQADLDKLKFLFDLLISNDNGTKAYTILTSGGDNTVKASVSINVSNDASDFDGTTAKIKIGETGTTVKVKAF